MVYTEVASKDAMRGVIVISETLDELCKDLLAWKDETKSNDLLPADIIDREANKIIGRVSFRNDALIIDPA